MKALLVISLLSMIGASPLFAETPPIADETVSPDKRFGITVPSGTGYPDRKGNSIVEVSTGKTVAVIEAATGAVQQNHGGIDASWTDDSQVLLWSVSGKWFPRALVLIEISEEEEVRQLDLLKQCQEEILKRVKADSPERYELTRKAETGSAYPDGFTIMLDWNREPLSFPLEIAIELTNDPKGMADSDPDVSKRLLKAGLKAEVKRDFSVAFSNFEMMD